MSTSRQYREKESEKDRERLRYREIDREDEIKLLPNRVAGRDGTEKKKKSDKNRINGLLQTITISQETQLSGSNSIN